MLIHTQNSILNSCDGDRGIKNKYNTTESDNRKNNNMYTTKFEGEKLVG